jgi:hypothetical protein
MRHSPDNRDLLYGDETPAPENHLFNAATAWLGWSNYGRGDERLVIIGRPPPRFKMEEISEHSERL